MEVIKIRGKDKIGEPHQIGNIVRRIVAPNGCVDLICDDYCRDKTPEDREAAFRRAVRDLCVKLSYQK